MIDKFILNFKWNEVEYISLYSTHNITMNCFCQVSQMGCGFQRISHFSGFFFSLFFLHTTVSTFQFPHCLHFSYVEYLTKWCRVPPASFFYLFKGHIVVVSFGVVNFGKGVFFFLVQQTCPKFIYKFL